VADGTGWQARLRSLMYDVRGSWHRAALGLLSAEGAILDLACGKGGFLDLLGPRGVGLDWNPHSLGQVRAKGHLAVRGTVLALPFASCSFAGVHAADIIEHFPPEDARLLLAEAVRVLRPGGRLVISTPCFGAHFYDDPTHVRPYPAEALLGYCTPAAAKGEGTNPTLGDLPAPVRFVTMRTRHSALVGLPRYAMLPEQRTAATFLRPRMLGFMAANVLARFGIRNPRPAGYLLVMERIG